MEKKKTKKKEREETYLNWRLFYVLKLQFFSLWRLTWIGCCFQPDWVRWWGRRRVNESVKETAIKRLRQSDIISLYLMFADLNVFSVYTYLTESIDERKTFQGLASVLEPVNLTDNSIRFYWHTSLFWWVPSNSFLDRMEQDKTSKLKTKMGSKISFRAE